MRLAIFLGSFSALNIILTFFYQWYILTSIGPGSETDALFAGMVVPEFFIVVLTGSLTHVLVPLFSVQHKDALAQTAWTFIQGIGLIFVGLALILFFTSSLWVPWTVPGFQYASKLLTISVARIYLIGMVFTSFNVVIWAYYHARMHFIWAELSLVIATILGLFFLLWALPRWGIVSAVWAFVLRLGVQTLLLIPGLGIYRAPDWRNHSIPDAWQRLCPLLLGTVYYKTDQLIDRFLASMSTTGQLSLLYLARQIYIAGNTILGKAFTVPIFPLLAQQASKKNWISFRKIITERTLWLLGMTSFVFLIMILAGKPLLSMLFVYGKFEISNIAPLQWLLVALVGLWIGGAVGQILSTGFYAKTDTKTPTKIGMFGYTLGVGLKIAGFYIWGVIGIAAGTSIYFVLNAVLMNVFLSCHIKQAHVTVSEGDSL